jgi:hypothetical protein
MTCPRLPLELDPTQEKVMRKTYVYSAIAAALLALAINGAQAETVHLGTNAMGGGGGAGKISSIGSQSSGLGSGRITQNAFVGPHALNPQPLPPGLRRPLW